MYTEENEFDYNDYLEETSENNLNNKSNKGLIIKVIIILVCIVLAIFLMFKFINRKNNTNSNQEDNSLLVFNNNVSILKSAGEKYFFKEGNLPEKNNDIISVNINDLKKANLISDIRDYEGNKCGYSTSYISLMKNSNDYKMEISLKCSDIEDLVVYYYDLEYNCLNCNGEEYISEEKEEDKNDKEENNDNTEVVLPVCDQFGEWTLEYIEDNSLERETRKVVIAYKENITYGSWSEPTLEEIVEKDDLEVKVETKEETVNITSDWSKETTKKPETKEGREISSRKVSKPYTVQNCSTNTYTKNLTYWDNSAKSCKTAGIGKVTCTYETKTCSNITKYKSVTYYKYRDTITTTETMTYYSSREIIKGTTDYTDYILENEIPKGYTKLEGSEITQYRYREKCSK